MSNKDEQLLESISLTNNKIYQHLEKFNTTFNVVAKALIEQKDQIKSLNEIIQNIADGMLKEQIESKKMRDSAQKAIEDQKQAMAKING